MRGRLTQRTQRTRRKTQHLQIVVRESSPSLLHRRMGKLKSARHHWWPECVSRLWASEAGGVHWLRPNGVCTALKPGNLGAIGNGHHIKWSNDQGTRSPWDESFEGVFQTADKNFPGVIKWLEGLPRAPLEVERRIAERLISVPVANQQFQLLVECLVSLAVRSPMHRDAAIRDAEHFRGAIEPRERSVLIGLNIRNSLRNALQQIGGRGKAMVVFSPAREFIFGDGFFNNLRPPLDHILSPKLFVPLTPRMAVLFTRPSAYTVDPRLVTLVVSNKEADELNLAVQVYAKEAIYYRSECPVLTDHFAQSKHLAFADHRNPIDELIHQIPGIPPRPPWLDTLVDRVRR